MIRDILIIDSILSQASRFARVLINRPIRSGMIEISFPFCYLAAFYLEFSIAGLVTLQH